MAELISTNDSLNEGRKKLNKSIEQSERAENKSENAIKTSDEAKSIAQTAENKSDSVQEQFNQVVIDGDSSVEAAQARVDAKGQSHPTLKVRIDEFENNTNRQLAQIGSMSPKGAFNTLGELESDFPTGVEGIYIVQEDGNWYFWNGSEWESGGVYQATPWDEFMTVQDEEWVI